MATIATTKGKIDTSEIPQGWAGLFCVSCGDRVGWIESCMTDDGSYYVVCDECMADIAGSSRQQSNQEEN